MKKSAFLAAKFLYRSAKRRTPKTLQSKIAFFRTHGYWPNYQTPRTFSEHIHRIKMHPNSDAFAPYSDKVLVKDYVRKLLGDEWVIPTIWTGTSLSDFAKHVPNVPFVIKANHGSGMNYFVKSPELFNIDDATDATKNWLQTSWWDDLHENWYNLIDRKLLAEPLICGGALNVSDYKLFVLKGKVGMVQVDTSRFSGHRRTLYSTKWDKLPLSMRYPVEEGDIPPPRHLEKMIHAAERLGQDFEFVRADFYDLESGPVFGELTFAPGSGLDRFSPRSFDFSFGSFLSSGKAA